MVDSHPHVARVARRIDTITTEAIELETERIIDRCTNLEPGPDNTYRQPDRTKFTAPTILDAESRVLRVANAPSPFQVAALPDHSGQIRHRSRESISSFSSTRCWAASSSSSRP